MLLRSQPIFVARSQTASTDPYLQPLETTMTKQQIIALRKYELAVYRKGGK